MSSQPAAERGRSLSPLRDSYRDDARHAACGLLMGAADIVPGVSGGTVALILGIYTRLVNAISRFDSELVRLLTAGRWIAAWQRVDARFLLGLGTGIAVGILSLAKLMRFLLEFYELQTMAVFFGLILGSTWIVARQIKLPPRATAWRLVGLGVIGAVLAWWLVGLPLLSPRDESVSLGYVFVCGVIAICAMILPGVSGAYFLLVLGVYEYVTDIIHRVTSFSATLHDWATIVVFSAGCATGLIGFSKVLRWLLARFEPQAMAVLCGLMLGSLRRVWPFQDSALFWTVAGLAAAAAASVVLLEYVASRRAPSLRVTSGERPEQSLGSPAE